MPRCYALPLSLSDRRGIRAAHAAAVLVQGSRMRVFR